MLKAELQKEYRCLVKDSRELREQLEHCRNKFVYEREVTKGLRAALDDMTESEHALRCVRMPHLELENETLKDQVSRLLKRVRRDDISYKDLAATFQIFIQRTQTEDFIWGMRDPKVPRDD